ncbi:cell number regulator 8-like [Tripterygium wilfordii]|uniref:cell number regulator 8-like n=1 Tax=Tripterygium wilfordii TaxID=458696 RepID=UPI0018F862D1|nr:cell number regulator 8-like [Tripterygium wilfordii]
MANNSKVNNQEESNPLLDEHLEVNGTKSDKTAKADDTKTAKKAVAPESGVPEYGWTANGMPLGDGSVMGEPMGRAHWDSSLCACLGRNDDFCSSDLEVCLLGSVAPCVLYGSNVERLGSVPGTFSNHCFPYTGLYLIGNSFFGWNCLAPLFSYPTRTAIRRKFNLEGSCEALNRSCGCCGSCVEDELQRELFESTCDLTTHICCHPCALCQEGREIRRRLPHPGFSAQPVLVMIPPGEQSMGRGA